MKCEPASIYAIAYPSNFLRPENEHNFYPALDQLYFCLINKLMHRTLDL